MPFSSPPPAAAPTPTCLPLPPSPASSPPSPAPTASPPWSFAAFPPAPASAPPPLAPSLPPFSPSSTSPAPVTPSEPPASSPLPSYPPPSPPPAVPPASVTPPPLTPPALIPPAPATPSASPPKPSALPGLLTPAVPSPPPPTPSSGPPPTPSGGPLPTPSGGPPPSPPPPPLPLASVSVLKVAGITVAALVLLAVLGTIFCCIRKKKRRNKLLPLNHDGDNLHGGQPQNWQYNAQPTIDHVGKVPQQSVHLRLPCFSYSHQFSFLSIPQPPPLPVSSKTGGFESKLPSPSPGLALSFSNSTFTYKEMAMATNGFSASNLLGQGGFGYVHKGVLRNGNEVAIKQLKIGSRQGDREFLAEVEIISRVHHRNLISLVGYCNSGSQRMLVYEYVPNKTLEFHLHGKDRPKMDWPTRMKIALGSAKGLAYLHEDCHPKIIHRDIKAANILLDFNFEAKVADFGLAKFTSDNNTHIATRIMGTFGYLAPEYASCGKLTEKSDVYSFGVVLLELITGKPHIKRTRISVEDSLVEWARPLLTQAMENSNYNALVDPLLEGNYNPNEMSHMVACAAACVRYSARHRPMMSQIVRALEGDMSLEDLNGGIRPGHSSSYSSNGQYVSASSCEGEQPCEMEMGDMKKNLEGDTSEDLNRGIIPDHGSSYGSNGRSDYDARIYNEDMKRRLKVAMESRNFASSDPTSEHGQNVSSSRQTGEMEMSDTKKDLEGNMSLEDLNGGSRPGHGSSYGSNGRSDYDASRYNEDMKRRLKAALESQNFAGSEYSDPTSEHGQNVSSSRQTGEMEMGDTKRDVEGNMSLEDLNRGIRPGHGSSYGSNGCSNYDSSRYNEGMQRLLKAALESRNFASSEYSDQTSEYGQNVSASSSEGEQMGEMKMSNMKKDSRGLSSN